MSAVVCGLVVAGAMLFGGVPSAWASVALGVVPNVPSPLAVGQANVASSLTITNTSTGAETLGNVTLSDITLVPSCGSSFIGAADCPPSAFDPGVLRLSATGVGQAGSACAGMSFQTAIVDAAQGKYRFISSPSVVLGPPGGPTASCVIGFGVDVLRTPRVDAAVAPGIQTNQGGLALGTSAFTAATGGGVGFSQVTIDQGSVPMTTQVAPSVIAPGSSFHDTAMFGGLAGGATPTGSVTFNVYGPNNASCTGPAVFTSINPVGAAPATAVSNNFTPSSIGTYRVIATYSGDGNYNSSSSSCADPAEAVLVQIPQPTPPGGTGTGSMSTTPTIGTAPTTGTAAPTTGTASADTTSPGVTGYGLANNPFVVAGGSTPTGGLSAAKKHTKGTAFRYTLTEAATVKIAITQSSSGRRKNKKCVAPTTKLRKAKKCTRFITKGTLTRTSHPGANNVAFSGRIGSKALSLGRYQATLTATDNAGNTSTGQTISFTIVKR